MSKHTLGFPWQKEQHVVHCNGILCKHGPTNLLRERFILFISIFLLVDGGGLVFGFCYPILYPFFYRSPIKLSIIFYRSHEFLSDHFLYLAMGRGTVTPEITWNRVQGVADKWNYHFHFTVVVIVVCSCIAIARLTF